MIKFRRKSDLEVRVELLEHTMTTVVEVLKQNSVIKSDAEIEAMQSATQKGIQSKDN